jgi:hypothetical protein
MKPQVGQIWRWSNPNDHPDFQWDELWLLLNQVDDTFCAVDLETGRLMFVLPDRTPENWAFVI